ncbi:hypothetical protein [Streptomyces sennicomposti]
MDSEEELDVRLTGDPEILAGIRALMEQDGYTVTQEKTSDTLAAKFDLSTVVDVCSIISFVFYDTQLVPYLLSLRKKPKDQVRPIVIQTPFATVRYEPSSSMTEDEAKAKLRELADIV